MCDPYETRDVARDQSEHRPENVRGSLNVTCKAHTPSEIVQQLHERGISRSERVLEDWRRQRFLPPLKRVGLGQGSGTEQVWTVDVLDQVIAAHHLMEFYGRAEYVTTGLWLAGFDVDPSDAKAAWIERIRHDQSRLLKQAGRLSGGFWALAKRWFKKERLPASGSDFLPALLEWRYDDVYRDSEAFWLQIVESFGGSATRPVKSKVDTLMPPMWRAVKPESLFVPAEAIAFLESATPDELNRLTPDLRTLRGVLDDLLNKNPSSDRLFTFRMTVRLMGDLLGPAVIAVIRLRRTGLELPLSETLEALREYARTVQWSDLNYKENKGFSPTRRVQKLWVTMRRKLRRAWSA